MEEKRRFDWRTIAFMFVIVSGQGLIQYGIDKANQEDLSRRVERIEQKLDDRMLPRDEFEKRHQDLEKRVEDLREREQQLEMEKARPRN